LLQQIERTTRSPIETLELPTAKEINALRVTRLQVELEAAAKDIDLYLPLIKQFTEGSDLTAEQIAAATLKLMYKKTPLFMDEREPSAAPARDKRSRNESDRGNDRKPAARRSRGNDAVSEGMQRYWLGVGYQHGVKPGNIVGAIANEAGVDSQYIVRIDISENFSTVDLPDSIPAPMLQILKRARICGQPLNIRPWSEDLPSDRDGRSTKPKRKPSAPRRSNASSSNARQRA
jgi:ATP-dependent RNA helicase DeaD